MDEVKIVTSLTNADTAISVKDVSDYAGERANFAIVSFWSSDGFQSDVKQIINEMMASEHTLAVDQAGNYKVAMFAVPKYSDTEVYSEGDITFKVSLNASNDAEFTLQQYSDSAWTPITTEGSTAAQNYASFVASSTSLATTATETVPDAGFTVKKKDIRTFTVTSTLTGTYKIYVYTFEDYINGREPEQTLDLAAIPVDVVLSKDDIWILVITADDISYKYHVIYSMDDMRLVMKSMLKKILCPTHLPDCPLEYHKQLESDRLFITKVVASMATVIGMIHSEQVDHYHYFSMDESRLAALQRANDILQKVLALFADYDCTIPCVCHAS